MPCVTKVMLLHFMYMLPSVTKVLDTNVTQNFHKFANIFNIVKFVLNRLNLAPKCRPTSWLSDDLKFEGYSWDFPNRNSMQRGCLSAVSDLEKHAHVEKVTSKSVSKNGNVCKNPHSYT